MVTEFQYAPDLGVFQDGFILAIAEKHKLVEYPAPALLGLISGYNGLSGNLAVKNPLLAYAFRLGLLPCEVTLLKTHIGDVAPPPVQIDGTGDPVCAR